MREVDQAVGAELVGDRRGQGVVEGRRRRSTNCSQKARQARSRAPKRSEVGHLDSSAMVASSRPAADGGGRAHLELGLAAEQHRNPQTAQLEQDRVDSVPRRVVGLAEVAGHVGLAFQRVGGDHSRSRGGAVTTAQRSEAASNHYLPRP